ncbi:MAG: sensor domain-containing diguanylate cyclase [Spirochaetaceae bacterium]|jgi:diguanylate cyclase (GGDEF)-like protein|nr:sensor domain-containing diguanylate cyclase [Spirochaetaceae bacterium]
MELNGSNLLSNPQIKENYDLLERIGIFDVIEKLGRDIRNYQSLLFSAAEIFNRVSIEEIMDAAVSQINKQYLPSFVAFLWKPLQNRTDVVLKSYRDSELVSLPFAIESIAPFEPFFSTHREPILYSLLRGALEREAGTAALIAVMDDLGPELVIPILGLSGLYGLILVGAKQGGELYTEGELLFISQLMSFVSQAIQSQIHYEHSTRDAKTGLFNHAFLVPRLNEELARVKRTGFTSSLIVIDVDKFKNFNDTYGHLAGDRVLEYLAAVIKKSVRNDDVPSRFGGEEFTILLPNTTEDSALLVARRLRNNVAAMTVPWDPPLPRVTISLGVVSFDRDTGAGIDEVIHRGDEALYHSKKSGRNCTSLWREHGPIVAEGDEAEHITPEAS